VRSRGGSGEVAATARSKWGSHHCVPRENGPVHLLG
jgi:hypothetical protein